MWAAKKADWTCWLGCFPNDTASSAQRVGTSLVKGKRVSMVGKKADWMCWLGCFPNDTASSAQRVGISLVKGKRVSMVGKKSRLDLSEHQQVGVSPMLLQVEHNGLAISLVRGQRVSMVGKKADWICRKID